MRNLMHTIALFIAFLLPVEGWAMNSLVAPGDMEKMAKAGIGKAVIESLLAHQTSSVNADHLIQLKRSGADEKLLQAVILADRYKNPQRTDLAQEQAEVLKKAGFSEEMIMRLFNVPSVKTVVDQHGNARVVYSTGSSSPSETATESDQNRYYMNIERVGKE